MNRIEQLRYKNRLAILLKRLQNEIGDIFIDNKNIKEYDFNNKQINSAMSIVNEFYYQKKCKKFSEKSYAENLKSAFDYLLDRLMQQHSFGKSIILSIMTSEGIYGVELKTSDFLSNINNFYNFFLNEYNKNQINDIIILDKYSNKILAFIQTEYEMYLCFINSKAKEKGAG